VHNKQSVVQCVISKSDVSCNALVMSSDMLWCLINYIHPTIYIYLFCYVLFVVAFTQYVKALNGLLCADVPLRNYGTHSLMPYKLSYL